MEVEEYIKSNVSKGVNTDWLAQPVRNAVSHSHSLYLEGGSDAVIYGLGANYNRNNGVMKKSYREVLGVSFDLTYRVREKINIRNILNLARQKYKILLMVLLLIMQQLIRIIRFTGKMVNL